MNTVYFSQDKRGLSNMSAVAIQETLKQETKTRVSKNRVQSINKETTKMTPVTTNLEVQKTVFDLQKFDYLTLVKEVPAPPKPASLKEATEMFGNDTDRLLNIIYSGIVEEARETAKNDLSGFKIVDEDKEENEYEAYTGTFADEAKGKLIRAAVLSLAKMQGYDKNKTREEKAALKETARAFLRSNPAMLASLQK